MWGHRDSGIPSNAADPVSLVLDLRLANERLDSSADPNLNGNVLYPNDEDRSLNEAEFVRLLFLQTHRETDRFFAASGVQLA